MLFIMEKIQIIILSVIISILFSMIIYKLAIYIKRRRKRKLLFYDPHGKKNFDTSKKSLRKEQTKLITDSEKYPSDAKQMNIELARLNYNSKLGHKIKKPPCIPKDLTFSYSITMKLKNNSNSYTPFCFFYRGNELLTASPSIWIDPRNFKLIIKILDYENDTMTIQTNPVPLQRWNKINFVFRNRIVDIHLNGVLFKTATLPKMPKYEEERSIRIHPQSSSDNLTISKIEYFDYGLKVPY